MLVGSHVSMSGKGMLLAAAKEAASYHETAMMIYTGAPQNTRRKAIDQFKIYEGREYLKNHGIQEIVIHAPYIINLGNTYKPDKFSFAVDFLHQEIERADAIGAKEIVLHPGAHVGAGSDKAIASIIKGLNEAMTADQNVQIAIETMAGKGTEVGINFEQIAQMISGVKLNDKLAVCFDTCHTNDAGYNVKDDFDGVMEEFDKVIGIDRIKVFHLNDSKNPMGSHKDRHENLGYGTIGFDSLSKIAHNEQFIDVPKILETPHVAIDPENDPKNKVAPYGYEIAELNANQFNDHLYDDVRKNVAFNDFLNY